MRLLSRVWRRRGCPPCPAGVPGYPFLGIVTELGRPLDPQAIPAPVEGRFFPKGKQNFSKPKRKIIFKEREAFLGAEILEVQQRQRWEDHEKTLMMLSCVRFFLLKLGGNSCWLYNLLSFPKDWALSTQCTCQQPWCQIKPAQLVHRDFSSDMSLVKQQSTRSPEESDRHRMIVSLCGKCV